MTGTNLDTIDPLLNDRQAGDVVGAAAATMKQARHTGMLFGEPAPTFVKLGRSTRYKLSVLLEFRDQFQEYQNTSQYGETIEQE